MSNFLYDFKYLDKITWTDHAAEERTPGEIEDKKDQNQQEVQIDTFRVIGVRRSPGECLVCIILSISLLTYHFSISS